ncbi:MAG: hypothetical protein L0177_18330 [Chloroflexi bacterium]|nr:hypothetical protein [Chloroflexota bacterium]
MLATFFLLLYLLLVGPTFMTGDAVVYLDQMRSRDLQSRSGHLGYYLLGIPLTRLLPVDDTFALNAMSSFLAALGVASIYLIALRITGSRLAARVASASSGMGLLWLLHAVFAQYIMLQTTLLCATLLAWLALRPLLAGFCFGAALLTTPLAALSLPLLLARRIKIRELAFFVLGASLLYTPFLALRYQDLFWGPRGIFASKILDPGGRLSLPWSTLRVGYHTALEFSSALLVALPRVAEMLVDQLAESEPLVQFADKNKTAIGGDTRALEIDLEKSIEGQLERLVSFVTHSVSPSTAHTMPSNPHE